MSRNYYCEINLHVVWHTKESAALLTPEIEPAAWRFLRKRIVDNRDVFVHEIGGTATHVHIAVAVPPTLMPSTFIGELKGGTSHDVNHQFDLTKKVLEWQAGYGIVSFGTKDLEWVKKYIRNQKQHHANGNAVDRLERIMQDHD